MSDCRLRPIQRLFFRLWLLLFAGKCWFLIATILLIVSSMATSVEAIQSNGGNGIPYIRKDEFNQYIEAKRSSEQRQQQKQLLWKSYSPTVEFLPMLDDIDEYSFQEQHEQQIYEYQRQQINQRHRRRYLENNDEDDDPIANRHADDDVYKVQPFVYGYDEYDEYQQSWRILGFIIDCHENNLRTYDDDNNSHDNENDDGEGTGEGCYRYVVWAAYVDFDYEGGGIGEYQYWNRETDKWDDSACEYSGSSRCAKMDCHNEDTHWRLLGFFKHRYIDDYFEQLFKHEGMCVWSEEEYAFMSNAREQWPQGCINSYQQSSRETNEDGEPEYIYYDMKPVSGGGIKMGLYTDTACVKEYNPVSDEDPITVENIFGDFLLGDGDGGSGDNNNWGYYSFNSDDWTFEDSMDLWTSALGAFTICQPCVAYDLENVDGSKYNDDYAYGENNNGGNGLFDCYDDADYTNVNQCMKFMAKTEMRTATFRDLSLARTQGTLNNPFIGSERNVNRNGYYRRQAFGSFLTWVFLIVSILICARGLFEFMRVKRDLKIISYEDFKQPLAPIT